MPGAVFPDGKRRANPDLTNSAPSPLGFHGLYDFIRFQPAIVIREARVIQIRHLRRTLPAAANGYVGTRAVIPEFTEHSTFSIGALQFLEHGVEVGTQLEQAAPAIAPQVISRVQCADGAQGYPNHLSEVIQHLVPTIQGFAHLASGFRF
jgi:hypothetical protein